MKTAFAAASIRGMREFHRADQRTRGLMKSILDPSFLYRPSFATDVRETIRRVREEMDAVSEVAVRTSSARVQQKRAGSTTDPDLGGKQAGHQAGSKSKIVLAGKAIAALTAIALASAGAMFAVNQPQPLLLHFGGAAASNMQIADALAKATFHRLPTTTGILRKAAPRLSMSL